MTLPEYYDRDRMMTRWRAERTNARTQLATVEAQIVTAQDAPQAYGADHLAKLQRSAHGWRILIADYSRYLGDELGASPAAEDAPMF